MQETTLADRVDLARRQQLEQQEQIQILQDIVNNLTQRCAALERQTGLDQLVERAPLEATGGDCVTAATPKQQLWPE